MNLEKMFEVAVRERFRFPFKGLISVEDLWQLSVNDLDSVFKTLNAEVKKVQEDSLLNKKTKEDDVAELKIEIVKYIFDVKLKESEARKNEALVREEKQKLYKILADKKDAELLSKSAEEIEKMIENLDK